MAVHLIHIPKTGGTAMKAVLRERPEHETRFGPVVLHRHRFRLEDVPKDDVAFFCVRDPVDRFVSAFYTRLRKNRPTGYWDWRPAERRLFTRFPTPQALATALAGSGRARKEAERGMNGCAHLRRSLHFYLGDPEQFLAKAGRIIFIARTETLDTDWMELRRLLDLGDLDLPDDPLQARRGLDAEDRTLTGAQREAIEDWYRDDFELLALCDQIRKDNGWQ